MVIAGRVSLIDVATLAVCIERTGVRVKTRSQIVSEALKLSIERMREQGMDVPELTISEAIDVFVKLGLGVPKQRKDYNPKRNRLVEVEERNDTEVADAVRSVMQTLRDDDS